MTIYGKLLTQRLDTICGFLDEYVVGGVFMILRLNRKSICDLPTYLTDTHGKQPVIRASVIRSPGSLVNLSHVETDSV